MALALLMPCILSVASFRGLAQHRMHARSARAAVRCETPSDSDFFASLRARIEQGASKEGIRPLGPDEVGADSLGPDEMVAFVMDALLQQRFDILLGFSQVSDSGAIDFLGQLQPGGFTSAEGLTEFLRTDERYRTMLSLSEWKPMGPLGLSNLSRNGEQKLLIRPASGNWEDLYVRVAIIPYQVTSKRWVITAMHKAGS
jgi:hypothetical protein